MALSSNSSSWWKPTAGTTWQIDLSTTISASALPNVTAIDADLYSNNASWPAVRAAGYKTICYFSAGSYEDWRSDRDSFLASDRGKPLDGWPGEWWLDTRSSNVRRIMSSRLDHAQRMGCDAVDPDNVDAYNNDGGGFHLTADDAVDYVSFLSREAHARGMAVGLKNALEIVPRVLDRVDFQVNEQCLQFDECSSLRPFITANKPVFEIEYRGEAKVGEQTLRKICGDESRRGFSTLVKHMDLGLWGYACAVQKEDGDATSKNQPAWSSLLTAENGSSSTVATTAMSDPAGNAADAKSISKWMILGLFVLTALASA